MIFIHRFYQVSNILYYVYSHSDEKTDDDDDAITNIAYRQVRAVNSGKLQNNRNEVPYRKLGHVIANGVHIRYLGSIIANYGKTKIISGPAANPARSRIPISIDRSLM